MNSKIEHDDNYGCAPFSSKEIEALRNLRENPAFQLVGIGNPTLYDDPHTVFVEPKSTMETETQRPKWLQSVGHENSGLEKCARCGGDGFIEREPGDQTSWVKCTRCFGHGVCPGRLNKKHYGN